MAKPKQQPASGREVERQGAVLEVARQLLDEGRGEKVLSLVAQLLERNRELERRLASRGFKNSEAVSSAQLLLLIDGLWPGGAQEEADEKLRIASAIDVSRFDGERTTAEPASPPPPLRRPPSAKLRRVANPISVPDSERPCPKGTDLLRPLWRAAQAEVLAAKVMHLDGTTLPVLDADTPKGIKLGALWGYVGRGEVETALYLYASTGKKDGQREGELGPADVLALRNGYAVADASGLFDSSFKREGLIECGCNMHARRYFTKALDAGDARAALPLAAFKSLYEWEAGVRDKSDAERLACRRAHSVHLYDELVAWCRATDPQEPPSSPLGKAIAYLIRNEAALRRFLGDGVVPIDNGIVERLHVRAALTRKNYLFAGSDAGGERAAIAYTILGCCNLAEVNPVEYLADVLPRLSRRVRLLDLPAMLPAPWKALRVAAAVQAQT